MSCKVSVIIPVCNVEKYLRQCLDSVCGQTLADIEIICVDDKSDDDSLEILKEYQRKDSRFIILENETRLGAAESRNKGIKIARGEYLSILDADDYFELNMLELAYDCCEKSNADICGYDFWEFDDNTGECIRQGLQPAYYFQNEYERCGNYRVITNPEDCFRIFNGGGAWQKMYRRKFIIDNSIFFQTLPNANDVFFSGITVVCAKRLAYIHQPLVWYRINRDGQTISKIDRYPLSLYLAMVALYEELVKRGIYICIKQKFNAYMVDVLFGIINQFSSDLARDKLYDCMMKDRLLTLGIKEIRTDEFFYYRSYWCMKLMVESKSVKKWMATYDDEQYFEDNRNRYFFQELCKAHYVCALWGMGELGRQWIEKANTFCYSVAAIIDQDVNKQGMYVGNIQVIDYSACPQNVNAVIITNSRYRASIADSINRSNREIVVIDFDYFVRSNRMFEACVFV